MKIRFLNSRFSIYMLKFFNYMLIMPSYRYHYLLFTFLIFIEIINILINLIIISYLHALKEMYL
jgi:general stress protein CsbA